MIYVIGLDGITTLSWPVDEFSDAKLFAAFAAMPMRSSAISLP